MEKMKLYFAKTNESAIIPSKREEDGAFDVYACFEEDYLVIKPHETVLVPTGIASAFSSDYVAILKERGSTGSKGIGQRCGVVDSGYRGEWFCCVTNHNEHPLVIVKKEKASDESVKPILEGAVVYPYEKAICQCIMVQVPKMEIQEISHKELMLFESERGTGALGSSGK